MGGVREWGADENMICTLTISYWVIKSGILKWVEHAVCMEEIRNTVKPLFIVFVGGLKKKQWIRESNRCGSHSINRIRSGTIEIERWIWENELSGKDR
jgi:hypothetical protein